MAKKIKNPSKIKEKKELREREMNRVSESTNQQTSETVSQKQCKINKSFIKTQRI